MKKIFVSTAIAFSIITLISCENIPTVSTLGVNMKLHPAAAARAVSETPVWTTAEARFTELVIDYDGPDGSFSATEPLTSVVNLLDGSSFPELPVFTLEPGTYTSINFELELLDDGTTPSIFLEGTWNGTPIRVVFISGEVFEAVAGSLTVPEGQSRDLTIYLDPDQWFDTLNDADLENAAVGIDGYIEISENRNPTLFDAHFSEQLDAATQSVLPGGTPD